MQEPAQRPRRFQAGRYAAIDIGTVTSRMLAADVDEQGTLREVAREYVITNLGEGVDARGVLAEEAMQRVARALRRYRGVLDGLATPDRPLVSLKAIATSAARDSRNVAAFEALVAKQGVRLSVIPGTREAALSFAGASYSFAEEQLLVIDVGGGSTEVIAGRAGGAPQQSFSFDLGCRRVTEKFFKTDPPSEEEQARARSWIEGQMRPYFDGLRAEGVAPDRLVAVAGTATTTVSVYDRMERYDSKRVHRRVVSRNMLDSVAGQLKSVPIARREGIVGLDPGRAPVIVAGMLILQTLLDLARADSFTVSETDILHGIILDEARL